MASFAFAVAIASLVTTAIELGVAGVVLAAAPTRGTNRALAAVLALKALTPPPGVFGALVDDRTLDYYSGLALGSMGFALFVVYVLFLGFALDTPLTAWLRRRPVRIVLFELMAFSALLPWLAPHEVLRGPGQHLAGVGWVWEQGPMFQWGTLVYVALSLFGLSAAVSAFRRAPRKTVARRRAKAYLLAFATQDMGVTLLIVYWLANPTQYNAVNIGNVVLNLAYSVLVASALLRTQLFDFDLKLKIGLTRGTVAAIFLVAFFVVTAIAEQYLQKFGFVAGGVAVGVLLFVLVPIQRAAESVADRVFPGVSDETGYLMRKKVEVYREALQEAMLPEGGIDPARTNALRKLRSSMGLSARDHELLLGAVAGSPRRAVLVAPGAIILGKYRVEREIGSGGGGKAYLAHDVRMHRSVVLKTVSGGDPVAAVREARAAAAIEHPNVVRVYDVEDLGSETLVVMEHVDGGSLKDRIAAGGALSDAAFAKVSDDILAALEAVQGAGAVHRDVKPGNILLTRAGHAKLSDFGTARLPDFEATLGATPSGSVPYMSPEQARGRRVTAQSDLYSAAAALYEARTGKPLVAPRRDETPVAMQARVGAARGFSGEMQPPALRAWFTRALAPTPQDRYPSAGDARAALAAALR